MNKSGKNRNDHPLTPKQLSSYFQGSSAVVLLYDRLSLTSLHTPPNFSLPLQIADIAKRVLSSLTQSNQTDHWEFLDFHWEKKDLSGMTLYGLKLSSSSLLLFLFPFQKQLHFCQKKICQKYNLSKRESDVVIALIEGASNEALGEKLGISKHTVRSHLREIFQKMEVGNRWEIGGNSSGR